MATGTVWDGMSERMLRSLDQLTSMRALEVVEELGDPDALENRMIARGDNPGIVRELSGRLREMWGDFKHFQGLEIRRAVRQAASNVWGGSHTIDLQGDYALSPRWKSTIAEIDRAENGGFYGIVVLGGSSGAGKSVLGAASGVVAAQDGDKVVFLYAEMSAGQIRGRIARAAQGVVGREAMARIVPRALYAPMGFDGIVASIYSAIEPDDENVLVVMDSINTLTDISKSGGDSQGSYFGQLNRIIDLLVTARRLTEGRFRALIISELNKEGGVKGGKPEYTSDLTIRLTKQDTPDYVAIDVRKGREGGGGPVGTFLIDWQHGRLIGERR